MQSEKLIDELQAQTKAFLNQIEGLKQLDLSTLTWKANETSWSILECIEHLNRYGEFYLPLIEQKLKHSVSTSDALFKSGYLGNYFAKSMLPKENMKKMKTFKDKNPLNALLNKSIIDTCIEQQNSLLDLMNQSRKASLNSIKIETSISKLIRLKLGDTFRFIINHNLRHLKQMECIQLALNK